MCKRLPLFLAVCLVPFLTALPKPALAQRGKLIDDNEARRFGLQKTWYTQIETEAGRGNIVHIQQYISPTQSFITYEVQFEGGKFLFSEKDVDQFGDVLGSLKAKQMATERADKLRLQGFDAKLVERKLPEISLFVVTGKGLIQVLDAETGRTKFVVQVGNREFPTKQVVVTEKYIATVNGSSLYLMDAKDGAPVWSRLVVGVPGAGPVISEEAVHVPMVSGKMESYELKKHYFPPKIFQSFGRPLVQPISTGRSIAWTTDRGHLYVGNTNLGVGDKKGIRFRFVCNDTVACSPVFLPPASLFLASIDGYLYHLNEMSGDLLWRFSCGDPISQMPLVLPDAAYAITDDGGLFAIAVEDGRELWWTPKIKRFIAASRDRLYCIGDTGRVVILDRKSGGRIGSLATEEVDLKYVNTLTDRVLIGFKSGALQCLREVQSEWPLIHLSGLEEKKPQRKDAADDNQPPAAKDPKKPAGDADPFGGAGGGDADPFGGGGGGGGKKPEPAGGKGGDPFGNDPFGDNKPDPAKPGGANPAADPFGN